MYIHITAAYCFYIYIRPFGVTVKYSRFFPLRGTSGPNATLTESDRSRNGHHLCHHDNNEKKKLAKTIVGPMHMMHIAVTRLVQLRSRRIRRTGRKLPASVVIRVIVRVKPRIFKVRRAKPKARRFHSQTDVFKTRLN